MWLQVVVINDVGIMQFGECMLPGCALANLIWHKARHQSRFGLLLHRQRKTCQTSPTWAANCHERICRLGWVVVSHSAAPCLNHDGLHAVNKKALEMFGYKLGQLEGKNVSG